MKISLNSRASLRLWSLLAVIAVGAGCKARSGASVKDGDQDLPPAAAEPADPGAESGESEQSEAGAADAAQQYDKFFAIANRILTRPASQKAFSQAYPEAVQVSAADQAEFFFPKDKLRSITEAQLVKILHDNPALVPFMADYATASMRLGIGPDAAFTAFWANKLAEAQVKDPALRTLAIAKAMQPVVLETPGPGYSDMKLLVTHARTVNGRKIPADNLRQAWVDFIGQAQKELNINVFEFDLVPVAQAILDAAQRGVTVRVGIDAGSAATNPAIQRVFAMLGGSIVQTTESDKGSPEEVVVTISNPDPADKRKKIRTFVKVVSRDKRVGAGSVHVHGVDSVGLNHQKLASADWSLPGKGRVIMSSGNLTQSCIGPEGDLVDQPAPRSPFSIPNANHMLIVKSDVLAVLVHNQLAKTIGPEFFLRGSQFPLDGAYTVKGPVKAGKQTSLTIAFTPGGAAGTVNGTMIAHMIDKSDGPVRMAAFAFAAPSVTDAMKNRFARDVAAGRPIDLKAVGDTPFAVADWSRFLAMDDIEAVPTIQPAITNSKGKALPLRTVKQQLPIRNGPWTTALGAAAEAEVRRDVRIAPAFYGKHQVTVGGASVAVTSKIHHKLVAAGDTSTLGSSFNFSDAAETNQEQLILLDDAEMAANARSIVDSLWADQPGDAKVGAARLLVNEVERKNRMRIDADEKLEDEVDSATPPLGDKEDGIAATVVRPNEAVGAPDGTL